VCVVGWDVECLWVVVWLVDGFCSNGGTTIVYRVNNVPCMCCFKWKWMKE